MGIWMKKNRKNKHIGKFIFIFSVTLIGITILGGAGLWIYARQQETDRAAQAAASKVMQDTDTTGLFTEAIPEEELRSEAIAVDGNTPEDESEALEKGKYAKQLSDDEYMKANRIYAKETAIEGEVTIAFCGDILFDPNYSVMVRLLQRTGGIHDSISQDLIMEMKNADIFMLNNEFPYSDRGVPTEGKQFTFRAKPEYVKLLHELGTDIVSLANNHAYDYGETALLDTFETLEGADIPFVGAGRNLDEAVKPVYFIAGDVKIAFVSATQIERLENPDTKEATASSPGVFRCLNPAKLLEVVAQAKENSDFVIVYIHWGTENTAEPDWLQLEQAPRIVEAGADLIIGDHSHCLQPIQYVEGVPVVYSLGNFWFNSRQVDTCLVKAVVNEEGLKSLQFLPALQKDCTTVMLHDEEKERVLAYMRSISPNIYIDENGYISE